MNEAVCIRQLFYYIVWWIGANELPISLQHYAPNAVEQWFLKKQGWVYNVGKFTWLRQKIALELWKHTYTAHRINMTKISAADDEDHDCSI